MKKKGFKLLLISGALMSTQIAHAEYVANNEAFNFWSDEEWIIWSDDDGETNPGSGYQFFDAEFLFYKYDKTTNNLSIGLQTGFDVDDGKVDYNNGDYFAGDLALSFDGVGDDDTNASNDVNISNNDPISNTYEYAIDFGLTTKDADGGKVGLGDNDKDDAGLYEVIKWNNNISHDSSSPFAMDEGTLIANALTSDIRSTDPSKSFDPLNPDHADDIIKRSNSYGHGNVALLSSDICFGADDRGGDEMGQKNWCIERGVDKNEVKAFFRTVTFNLDSIVGDASHFTVDAHWTMSCGNDVINGTQLLARVDTPVPVPEPSALALFGIGSLSLVFAGFRRSHRIREG